MINKNIIISLFFLLNIIINLNIYPEEVKSNDKPLETAQLIIEKIIIEGLKTTKVDYFKSLISIKEGSVWDISQKQKLEYELQKNKKIIETYEVIEEIIDKTHVNITIKILEKGSYIIIPFFTYSNSKGLQPKVIFRHYNLGGIGKYFKSKAEFIPTESLNFNFKYEDPAVLNNENLKYSIDSWLKTSIINYYVNVDPNNPTSYYGVPPLASLSTSGNKRWNEELFYEFDNDFDLRYTLPIYDITFSPTISWHYKKIQNKIKKNKFLKNYSQDVINPGFSFSSSIPFNKIRLTFTPSISYSYEHEFNLDYDTSGGDDLFIDTGASTLTGTLKFAFNIPYVDAVITPLIQATYYRQISYYHNTINDFAYASYDPTNISSDYVDLLFQLTFDKRLEYRNVINKFKVKLDLTERVFGITTIEKYGRADGSLSDKSKDTFNHRSFIFYDADDDDEADKVSTNYYQYLKLEFHYYYYCEIKFLQNHRIKISSDLFAMYNDKNSIKGYDINDSLENLKPGKLAGWAGLLFQFKYELPLFGINTPRFLSKNIKRPLGWEIYWDFYISLGLAQNNEPYIIWDGDSSTLKKRYLTSYTIDWNYLHLYPAIGLGTSIRVVPKFVPIEIKLNVGGDLWKIIRDKSVSGKSIILELSIDDKF